jgi:2-hydroxychromene-2-carboxylate isomerase
MRLELYFDFSCPYAYLAASRAEAFAAEAGAELCWRPMLLGGVFAGIGLADSPMEQASPSKARHNALDMLRFADRYGVPLRMPAAHPMRTVRALRALLALPEPRWSAAIAALYQAYWQRGVDFTDPGVIGDALAEAKVPADEIGVALAANDDQAVKDELRRRTDEAVSRGVFGAPTMFVDAGDGEAPLMFWGQDRFDMVAAALRGWRPPAAPRPPARPAPAPPLAATGDDGPVVDFWYDFSSPFAYLGSTQIEAVAARAGARVRWRPMLLGAVFRDIGTPNVPLFSMSDNKRRYLGQELDYWSAWWQVPFRFSSRFPMNTVTALRVALLSGDAIGPVSHDLFRLMWVDDGDLQDTDALAAILSRHGLDGPALVARTREPEVKQRLIDNTTEAVAAGVFGAPTMIVRRGGDARLFWGQDRLELVEAALGGWRPEAE